MILKRYKEKRTKILKQSLKKLKKIPDAEQCLRQAVLIRNTFIRAKDLSPRHFERQLLTAPADDLNRDHSDLLEDMHEQMDMNVSTVVNEPSEKSHYTPDLAEDRPQSCQTECVVSGATIDSRPLVAVL